MYTERDLIASGIIFLLVVLAAFVVSALTGCAAYSTMPDKAQIRAINTFRVSLGLDTLSSEDWK